MTSLGHPGGSLGGPIGRPEGTTIDKDRGGTDPWTGEARPETWTYTVTATGEQTTRVMGTVENYRAIPLPVGFAVGSLLTLVVIAARRPRKTASISTGSAT